MSHIQDNFQQQLGQIEAEYRAMTNAVDEDFRLAVQQFDEESRDEYLLLDQATKSLRSRSVIIFNQLMERRLADKSFYADPQFAHAQMEAFNKDISAERACRLVQLDTIIDQILRSKQELDHRRHHAKVSELQRIHLGKKDELYKRQQAQLALLYQSRPASLAPFTRTELGTDSHGRTHCPGNGASPEGIAWNQASRRSTVQPESHPGTRGESPQPLLHSTGQGDQPSISRSDTPFDENHTYQQGHPQPSGIVLEPHANIPEHFHPGLNVSNNGTSKINQPQGDKPAQHHQLESETDMPTANSQNHQALSVGAKRKPAVIDAKPGELYYGRWGTKKYPVMVCGWDDQQCVGYPGQKLGDLWPGLLESLSKCYRLNRQTGVILGWAPGYEDGGRLMRKRRFPVLFFDKANSVGWLKATDLSEFPHGHTGEQEQKAKAFYAQVRGVEAEQEDLGIETNDEEDHE